MNAAARSIVGIGLTEGIASQLAQRFALHQPPAGFDPAATVIVVQNAGFDLEIAYHNRRKRDDVPYRYYDDLEALAAWSDYLVVACPASPETDRRVDAKVLAALGPAGLLVNIARGSIIDEEALVAALET